MGATQTWTAETYTVLNTGETGWCVKCGDDTICDVYSGEHDARLIAALRAQLDEMTRVNEAFRAKLNDANLYADVRDAQLDDARRACCDAECFMQGFEEDDGTQEDQASIDEALRKLRAVLDAEAAEKATGAPGDVDAMRAAVIARRLKA